MTSGVAGVAEGSGRSARWPVALASLAVGAAFFALWFWLLPPWLGFRVETPGLARWRWIASVPSVLGFAVALKCIWDFGWTGRGTPAPMIPPKRLVVTGFYRYVRNPVYVGWAGLGGAVGGLRKSERDGNRYYGCRRSGHGSVRAVIRGADFAREVRRGLRGVLQERPALGAAAACVGAVKARHPSGR
jgi:hypothetical protein